MFKILTDFVKHHVSANNMATHVHLNKKKKKNLKKINKNIIIIIIFSKKEEEKREKRGGLATYSQWGWSRATPHHRRWPRGYTPLEVAFGPSQATRDGHTPPPASQRGGGCRLAATPLLLFIYLIYFFY
jgi:hypothetical protein